MSVVPRRSVAVCHEVARGYPVVAITGPRQAGKTTLARAAFPDLPYVSMEDPIEAEFFADDPLGFLDRFADGAVFDEVQGHPKLFQHLQGMVDGDRRMGRFVLTGSQQFGLLQSITQSLAGRVARIELLPFDRGELRDAGLAPATLDEALWRGGYPPIYDRPVDPARWHADYFATYVQRDVRQVVNVRDLTRFTRFVRLCATTIGQEVNAQRMGNDLGIDGKTLRAWLSVLESSYVLFLLPTHHRNFRKRLVKRPKLHFYDSGLACRLLDITSPTHLANHPLRGPIFESWVAAELRKTRFHRGLPANDAYWRSHDGLEVDILTTDGNGERPIEIKVSATPAPRFIDAITKWSKLAGDVALPGVVIYGGDHRRTLHGVDFVPWSHVHQLEN